MQRLVTYFVSAYWMSFFGILAFTTAGAMAGASHAALAGEGPVASPLMALAVSSGPVGAALMAVAFTLAAVMFLWTVVSALLRATAETGGIDDVVRKSFAIGVGAMAILLVVSATLADGAGSGTIGIHLIALLASFLAVFVERARAAQPVQTGSEGADLSHAAKIMALSAAHNSLLARISGRRAIDPEGGR